MKPSPPRVKDIGEQGLLVRLQRFCPRDIVGDDAAVLGTTPEQKLVVTTDMLVDGVHFSEQTTPPESVGWRAAAANLSDLAAMGAYPIGITVALSLPGEVSVDWVERLYHGLSDCLQDSGTPILGGDICRSSVITVAITALGEVSPERVIRRSSAQIGDRIVVTGDHGSSRAGLELLLHPELGQNLTILERENLIQAHQKPKPRLDVLPFLGEIEEDFSIAGMDSSDGLADAIIQICRLSRVGAEIERGSIPISPALLNWVAPEKALEWSLYGGEDFELVLCLPEKIAQILVKKLGGKAAIVGRIIPGQTVTLIDQQGKYPRQILTLTESFQHFLSYSKFK
jgi:thiamine-monophosphate kinase